MLRLRSLTWIVIGTVVLSSVAPALPAYATAQAAVTSPLRQDDVADHIAEIRSEDPDLEDDFSGNDSIFETTYDGTTSSYFKSGELHIAVDEENTLAWASLDKEVGDFYMEVEAIHRDGSLDNQFGILTRMVDAENYYLFAASSDGYYTIQSHVANEWQSIVEWQESDALNIGEGETNILALLAEGEEYTFLINDTIVDAITDDTLDGTGLALNAGAFSEPPIDIAYDNFRLWTLGDQPITEERSAPVDGRVTEGTPEPTGEATEEATEEPTDEPTEVATEEPTEESTPEPTDEATEAATEEVTEEVTEEPTAETTPEPTAATGTSSDPAIAAIQGQAPTFSDDFEDGDISDWSSMESDSVQYDLSFGSLDFIFSAPNVLSWSQLLDSPTAFYLETDATVASDTSGAEYGIIFNYVDPQNFYLYAINNANRYSVWRLVDNAWEAVREWTDSTALLSGEGNTNRLGLLADENTLTLTANDQVLATVELDEAPSGAIALAAGTFDEPDLTMSFDNLLLWDLDAIDALPTVEATGEATGEATEEATTEATEDPVNADFDGATARIAEITAAEPDISDDFRRDNGLWDVVTSDFGSSYYERRTLHIEAYEEGRIVWSSTYEEPEVDIPMEFTDYYVEFDTTFHIYTGENGAGLVFRMMDVDNFYKFIVDEIGYFQLIKRIDGEDSDIIDWTSTDAKDNSEGAVNRIGVLAEGSTLSFSINGAVVAQAEDSALPSGALALAIQSYSSTEAHSSFDNFDLWILNE